jgi:lia operon protein LiaF
VLGDIRRSGAWDVVDEEIWIGVGNVRLDLTEATVPTGEPKIQIFGFVGDVDLIVPQGVGVSVSSWAFVTDGKVFGEKEESFVVPLNVESDDYETVERRIHLETYFFVNDLTVKRA